jgi:HEAT repeat protein
LARLGDAEAQATVQEWLQSPSSDMRLLAAQAYPHHARGPWVEALLPLLGDPNGLTRVRAAELLKRFEPERVRQALDAAAADPNPVVRGDVARVVAEVQPEGPPHLKALRRMLRDADPSVRMRAGAALLGLMR